MSNRTSNLSKELLKTKCAPRPEAQETLIAVLEDGRHTVVFESLLIPELNGLRGLVLLGHVHHAFPIPASHTAGKWNQSERREWR